MVLFIIYKYDELLWIKLHIIIQLNSWNVLHLTSLVHMYTGIF